MRMLLIILFIPFISFAANRKIVFGELNWDSSRLSVAIARHIVEKGYDLPTTSVEGTTLTLVTAMSQGDVDIIMEVWKDNITDMWNKLSTEGKATIAGLNYPDATQGFYVPRYLIEGDAQRGIKALAPHLKSVEQLADYKHLFAGAESGEKGLFYNCLLGWTCELVNTKKLLVYGLNDHYVNIRPGAAAALDATLVSAYERGVPFLTYYWGPTWILGKYDLVQIKEPPYDEKTWQTFLREDHPKKATAFPMIKVYIGAFAPTLEKNPELATFLKKFRLSAKLLSELLVELRKDPKRDVDKLAKSFLLDNPDYWRHWVGEKRAQKVIERLKTDKVVDAPLFDIRHATNVGVKRFVTWTRPFLKTVSRVLLKPILLLERFFNSIPWFVLGFVLAVTAYGKSRNGKTALLLFVLNFIIYALGLWSLAMSTLSLVLFSLLFSTLLGVPLGILSFKWTRARPLIHATLDVMQTMPSFVYLIPALMIFGLGKVPALMATMIYAIVPVIRLTELGLKEVPGDLVEAAQAFGASKSQTLIKVELPLAFPTIMAGINQSIMLSLSMVVIASMIGARGLGEAVLTGIQRLDIGQGLTAGIGIVCLAMIIDRLGALLQKERSL